MTLKIRKSDNNFGRRYKKKFLTSDQCCNLVLNAQLEIQILNLLYRSQYIHNLLYKFGLLQVGFMYLTNLPIQGIVPLTDSANNKTDPSEVWLAIDSYIMNLRVWTRTSQLYMMEQQPEKHIK